MHMTVAILQFTVVIRSSHSLKDKRRVLRSLKDTARQKFNIAIAEIDALVEATRENEK